MEAKNGVKRSVILSMSDSVTKSGYTIKFVSINRVFNTKPNNKHLTGELTISKNNTVLSKSPYSGIWNDEDYAYTIYFKGGNMIVSTSGNITLDISEDDLLPYEAPINLGESIVAAVATARARAIRGPQPSITATGSYPNQWSGNWDGGEAFDGGGGLFYLGPFNYVNGTAPSTFSFTFDITGLGATYNANAYFVVPLEGQDSFCDANNGQGKGEYCPEYDIIETCGSVGGAFAFHCSLNDLDGRGGNDIDGGGTDRGMKLSSLPTTGSPSGTWDSTSNLWTDGSSIGADSSSFEVKVAIDYEKDTFKVTYGGIAVFDSETMSSSDFNNMWGSGGLAAYVSAMMNDLKTRDFYILSSVWDTGASYGGWYACQYDGLTLNTYGSGNSSSITYNGD